MEQILNLILIELLIIFLIKDYCIWHQNRFTEWLEKNSLWLVLVVSFMNILIVKEFLKNV